MGKVSGYSNVLQFTPNAAGFATPYSSGDVIGGVNEIIGAVGDPDPTFLVSITVLDKANQKAALDIVFFNANPESSLGADNAAYALADADLGKVLGRISIEASHYVSSGSNNAEATRSAFGLIPLKAASGTSIYAAVVARGAATYGSASDLSVKIGIIKD